MLLLLGAVSLALSASSAQAPTVEVEAAKAKDPIVCKGKRSSKALGSNMIRGRECKPKSVWDLEEKHSRRTLQEASDRALSPSPVPGAR